MFATRKVQLSRGGKEGNNAFTHDNNLRKRKYFDIEDFISRGDIPMSIIKYMEGLKIS